MCERMGLVVGAIGSAFLLFLALTRGFPWVLFVAGAGLLWLAVLCVCGYQRSRRRKRARREIYRQQRRAQRSETLAASLDLSAKPDFETRLRSFSKSETAATDETDLCSSMEFWQKEDLHTKTPTRPLFLFRYLLKRISRLVQGGH